MEIKARSKLKEVLGQEVTVESPVEQTEIVEITPGEQATEKEALQPYYDAEELAQELREMLGKSSLEDMEFEPGQYHLFLDTLGTLEDAAKFLEVEAGDNLQEALDEKANEVAGLLNQEIGFPGSFFFDLDEDTGEYDLMFFFEDSDMKDLEDLGASVKTAAETMAFTEIIAALEQEGCSDIAERLHRVLFVREQ
jgi:hypothetical protein